LIVSNFRSFQAARSKIQIEMSEIDAKIDQLQSRLENMLKYQEYFQREMSQIRYEINVLRAVQQKRRNLEQQPPLAERKPPVREPVPPQAEQPQTQQTEQTNYQRTYAHGERSSFSDAAAESTFEEKAPVRSDLEKFIGENLMSKIGIAILVLGVAIGAKYAIDRNLISPLMRIIIGYIFGFGLLGFAVKLKPKYHNFSAVLLSGAIAIMYFITYFAYSLYELLAQSSAFALMLIFTISTVVWAINYNRQIIAHVGLVGAYAVPFLLSDDSGKYAFLFTYIAIINAGILAISLKKYWKPLFYTSFGFTWAIYYGIYLLKYRADAHFSLMLIFLTVFFLIFYLTFIGYKLISGKNIAIENLALILANSFIFFGLGYALLDDREGFQNYTGLFTVLNAAIHFVFAFTASRLKNIPQDLIYLLSALVLTFAAIAVPVQLDGNWVTLVWTAEAVILFWIGRTKQISLYENYSFPLMFLGFVSLINDWQSGNEILFNSTFITAILVAAAFGFIHFLNKEERFEPAGFKELQLPLSYFSAAVALGVLYNAFRIEISDYFQNQKMKTAVSVSVPPYGETTRYDRNLGFFSTVWQINYTMLFLTALSFVNMRKFKDVSLSVVNFLLNGMTIVIFITIGLYFLGELRESYLSQTNADLFARGAFLIVIRYISYAFLASLLIACFFYIKQRSLLEAANEKALQIAFDMVFFVTLLWVLSAEVITWMSILGYPDSYKLGLSIFYGIYALAMVVVGIVHQEKKYLRVGAIVLFAFTLTKLFLYDISNLSTISKTIVFVSLGILLLIVSFLYNKYKHLIFETDPSEAG
jgi:uncharacterized membrane protein